MGILATGQSNCGFFLGSPDYGHGIMLDGIEGLTGKLRGRFNPQIDGYPDGFDGYGLPQGYKQLTAAQDTVYGTGGDAGTTYGGIPLYMDGQATGNFLGDNGGHPSTWQPGDAGQNVRRNLLLLTDAERAEMAGILWLHTETDSQTKLAGDRDRYKAAVLRWISLLRSWVGKGAAALPILTATPMPYGQARYDTQRMLHEVFNELATDEANNFRLALRHNGDADPRYASDLSHQDTGALRQWAVRLSYGIARWFNGLYGTPIPVGTPSTGPTIAHIYAESPTSSLVTVTHDQGANLRLGLRGDGTGAHDGRGWSVFDNGTSRYATSVALLNSRQFRVTHDACTGAANTRTLGYCLFGERLYSEGAIYDDFGSKPALPGLPVGPQWHGQSWQQDFPLASTLVAVAASSLPYGGGETGPAPPVSLDPIHLGTLYEGVPNGGVVVPVTITTDPSITSITWVVFRADFSWRGESTDVPTSGIVTIPPRFFSGGDTLKVWPTGNMDAAVYTEPLVSMVPPTGPYLDIAPNSPGELVADASGGADFTFTVLSGNGVKRLAWVMIGPGPDYFWDGFARVIDATGADQIPVRFSRQGEFFEVWDADNPSNVQFSNAVTLTTSAPTGPALSILSSPGTLYEPTAGAGAVWNFQIGTNQISRLGYVVVNADYSWVDGGKVITLPSSGSQVTNGSVVFHNSSQWVKAYDADNPGRMVDSGQVSLAVGTGGAGSVDPDGLAAARAWVKPLTLSFNVERAWAWAVPGGTAAYAVYLKSLGFTDVRLFYPWRPAYNMNGEGTARPSKWQFSRLLDAAAQYMAAGLKVRLYFGDVWTTYEDLNSPANIAEIRAHVVDCSAWCAERNFDVTKIAYGCANELGGDSDFTGYQIDWHAIMRAALPGHVLCCGANYWQAWSYLTSSTPWTDDARTLWPVHIYEDHNKQGWEAVRDALRAWSNAHGGLVVTIDEWGGGSQQYAQQPAWWMQQMDYAFPALEEFRVSFWCATQGSDWKWNLPGSGTLQPSLEAKVKMLALQTAINLGTMTPPLPPGSGSVPTPPVISVPVVPVPPPPVDLDWLFHDPVHPEDPTMPILLREAVTNTQANLVALAQQAAEAVAVIAGLRTALGEMQAATNTALAEVASSSMQVPTGPYDSDAAAAAGGVDLGGFYYEAGGTTRRRLK